MDSALGARMALESALPTQRSVLTLTTGLGKIPGDEPGSTLSCRAQTLLLCSLLIVGVSRLWLSIKVTFTASISREPC